MTAINIPDDTYRLLAARAAAQSTTPEALAASVLDQLARTPPAADTADWLRDFDAMLADFRALPPAYPPGHVVDVSREAIYAGCGE